MTHGVVVLKAVVRGAGWHEMVVPTAILLCVGLVAYAVAVIKFRWE
jgi:hypothetical protein